MKLEDHVLRAIEAFERGKKDEALMHALLLTEPQKISIQKNQARDYWGKENELKGFFSNNPALRVKLDKL